MWGWEQAHVGICCPTCMQQDCVESSPEQLAPCNPHADTSQSTFARSHFNRTVWSQARSRWRAAARMLSGCPRRQACAPEWWAGTIPTPTSRCCPAMWTCARRYLGWHGLCSLECHGLCWPASACCGDLCCLAWSVGSCSRTPEHECTRAVRAMQPLPAPPPLHHCNCHCQPNHQHRPCTRC